MYALGVGRMSGCHMRSGQTGGRLHSAPSVIGDMGVATSAGDRAGARSPDGADGNVQSHSITTYWGISRGHWGGDTHVVMRPRRDSKLWIRRVHADVVGLEAHDSSSC